VARIDGRQNNELRPVSFERGHIPHAEGSCLVKFGGTVVSCTASVEVGGPRWKKGSGEGWVTAEYAMLPRATNERTGRERRGAGGRTYEIQRLIGRSLRATIGDFKFGEYTITVDCDVLQADGGTRTASITGGAVALADACKWMANEYSIRNPMTRMVAAISVGVVDGEVRLDLPYVEDSNAEVDANIVMLDSGEFIEVQGTGEGGSFSRAQLDEMLDVAGSGIKQLIELQKAALG
jgi:ribonuclease PH